MSKLAKLGLALPTTPAWSPFSITAEERELLEQCENDYQAKQVLGIVRTKRLESERS